MYVEVEGARIHVHKKGQGRPILLLHGVPDSADMWQGVIDRLASHYTCYAPDLPGFHLSGLPSDFEFSLEHYGRFIDQLVCALGIDQPVQLVLHDWGGIFGMSFACQFPAKVSGIVGGSFPFTEAYRWHAWARIWRTPVLGELAMLTMNKALFKWEVKRGGSHIAASHIDSTYAKLDWQTRKVILKLYRSAHPALMASFAQDLANLAKEVPIDLVWGKKDIYVAPEFGRYLHPRTQICLEHCGHWVPVEAPQVFADMLVPKSPEA